MCTWQAGQECIDVLVEVTELSTDKQHTLFHANVRGYLAPEESAKGLNFRYGLGFRAALEQ